MDRLTGRANACLTSCTRAAGACFASNLVRRRLNEIAPPGQLDRYAAIWRLSVMNRMLRFILASVLLGMSSAYAQSNGETENRPFHISSRGSEYGVQGEFESRTRI